MMNREWTVGSLIPGRETRRAPLEPPARLAEEKQPSLDKLAAAVQWKQKEASCTVSVKPGVTLLDAALEQGCSIDYKCRKGTCGRCTVDILSGETFLSLKNEAEQKKLGASLRRLACQAVMREA